jgi:hypothetical protein
MTYNEKLTRRDPERHENAMDTNIDANTTVPTSSKVRKTSTALNA